MTAGLKCPPEMWPTAETITAIARPVAIATADDVVRAVDRRCAGADEEQRERADELGDRALDDVERIHAAEHTAHVGRVLGEPSRPSPGAHRGPRARVRERP